MIRSQSHEESQVKFEYEWYSSFGRGIAQENLKKIKLKVNDIIKTWKDSGATMKEEIGENSKGTGKALRVALDELQASELKIKIPGMGVTAFVYNPQTRNLALGFRSGEIAFASLFRDEQLQKQHTRTHKFFKLEDEETEIEDMFLVSDFILAVSKKRIFLFKEPQPGQPLSKNKIFDLDDNQKRELSLEGYTIKDVKYSPSFDLFYMLCCRTNEKTQAENNDIKSRIIVCFQVLQNEVQVKSYHRVSIQIHEFETDCHDQNQVYAVSTKDVRRVTLKSPDSANNIPKIKKRKSFLRGRGHPLFGGKSNFETKKNVFFSQPKTGIKSFKFDQKMNYFYINDEKTIKKYETKTKSLVHQFAGHTNKINSFSFSGDSTLMFSLDDDREIKIWDLQTCELKSTLNKKTKTKKIKDITMIDGGLQLATRNNEGIILWRLRRGYRPFQVKESKSDPDSDPDLSYSSLVISKDERFMFFNFDEKKLFKIDLKNNMQQVYEINLPWHEDDEDLVLLSTFTSNGELLLFWEVPRGNIQVQSSGCLDDNDESEDEDDRRFRLDLIIPDQLAKWASGNRGQIVWDEDIDIPGIINLKKFQTEELTVLNVITNDNQITQGLYKSNANIMKESLIHQNPRLNDGQINVYFGTDLGNCFRYTIHLSEPTSSSLRQFFTNGHPRGKAHDNEYLKTERLGDSMNNTQSLVEFDQTLFKNSPNRIINDVRYFVEEDCEIILLSQLRNNITEKRSNQYLHVFVRPGSNIDLDFGWETKRYNLGSANKDLKQEELFKVQKMISKTPGSSYRFYATGGMGILLFTYSVHNEVNRLKLKKFFPKRISPEVGVVHCPDLSSFFIPFKNQIQVWRDNLKTKTYTIDCESPVVKLYMSNSRQLGTGSGMTARRDILLVYEEENYREISTDSMLDQRRQRITVGGDIPLNLDAFQPGFIFTFPRLQETVKRLTPIMDVDSLDLASFPFESLAACFNKEDFREPIIRLAEYFFKRIKARSNENWCYGPMNPLNFAIYHNDVDLLEELIEKHGYPRVTAGYLSPLSFSFKLGYQSAVKVLCDYLSKTTLVVNFSRADFRYLLDSPFGYCHRLLATIPSSPALVNFRKFLSFDQNIALFFIENMGQLPAKIDKFEENDGKIPKKKKKNKKNEKKKGKKGKGYQPNYFLKKETKMPKNMNANHLLNIVKKKTRLRNSNNQISNKLLINNENEDNLQPQNPIRLQFGQNPDEDHFDPQESRDHHSIQNPGNSLKSRFNLNTKNKNINPLNHLKNQLNSNNNKDKKNFFEKIKQDQKRKDKLEKKKRKIQEIEAVQVPFKFSYLMGTPDSVDFLDSYSKCKTEDFIISDWQEVVIYKWKKYKPFHVTIALLYWTFTLLSTMSIVFYPEIKGLQGISLLLLFIFWFYEIIEFIAYSFFKIGRYFKDPWNIIDWFNFISLLIYFSAYHGKPEKSANKLLSTVSLIILFYRSFSYLRIISYFTTLVGMINVIISKLAIFFMILLYFYFGATLLIINLDPIKQHAKNLTFTYVLTVFGGIDSEQFFQYKYAGIALVFGTIIVTVILMNILIAFLSNLFSRLEEQQHVNALKEKASMILDLEVVVRFFRYYLTGSAQALRKHQLSSENFLFHLGEIAPDSKPAQANGVISPKVQALLKKRRLLYIFRSVDFAESQTEVDIDENIYKKIKVLGKTVDTMKKDRMVNDKLFKNSLSQIDNKLQILINSKKMG